MNVIRFFLLIGLFVPLCAFAQDGTSDENPKVFESEDETKIEEKAGVVIIEEREGDGPAKRQVIILEGDDLDGFDFDLDALPGTKGVHTKLRVGMNGEEFEFEGFEGFEGLEERLKGLKRHLKAELGSKLGPDALEGLDALDNLKGLLDPAKLKGRIEKGIATQRAARTKRLRDAAVEALKLDKEAASVVVPILDDVLETKQRVERDLAKRRVELRKDLALAKGDEAVGSLLDTFREEGKKDRQELATSREKLRGILTLEQEFQLVLRDILD